MFGIPLSKIIAGIILAICMFIAFKFPQKG